ncbi:MAG: hypothetical protein R3D80_20460 [Paracoccaceae bacterium]
MGLTATKAHLVPAIAALVAGVLVLALGGAAVGSSIERTVTVFFVSLTAIAAMGLYSGNSGVLSFGHLAFMGVGAYASALLDAPRQHQRARPAGPAGLAGRGRARALARDRGCGA